MSDLDQTHHRDAGKPRWSLVPVRAMRAVQAVFEFGAAKYAARSYLDVPNAKARYTESLMRHAMTVLEAVQDRGAEAVTVADDETGLPHLAHLVCDALILLDLAHERMLSLRTTAATMRRADDLIAAYEGVLSSTDNPSDRGNT